MSNKPRKLSNETRQVLINQLNHNLKRIEGLAQDMETEKFEAVRSLQLISIQDKMEEVKRLFTDLMKDRKIQEVE